MKEMEESCLVYANTFSWYHSIMLVDNKDNKAKILIVGSGATLENLEKIPSKISEFSIISRTNPWDMLQDL